MAVPIAVPAGRQPCRRRAGHRGDRQRCRTRENTEAFSGDSLNVTNASFSSRRRSWGKHGIVGQSLDANRWISCIVRSSIRRDRPAECILKDQPRATGEAQLDAGTFRGQAQQITGQFVAVAVKTRRDRQSRRRMRDGSETSVVKAREPGPRPSIVAEEVLVPPVWKDKESRRGKFDHGLRSRIRSTQAATSALSYQSSREARAVKKDGPVPLPNSQTAQKASVIERNFIKVDFPALWLSSDPIQGLLDVSQVEKPSQDWAPS